MMDTTVPFIIFLLITFIIFLIVRSFWLWYWNINKRIDNQEEIIRLLSENNRLLRDINNNISSKR
jgi:large-conductance mechanosensitive channel